MPVPTTAEQLRQVRALEKTHEGTLREGERYYVVSSAWWKAWLAHVENGGTNPEIVDNSDLVDETGQALKDDGVSEGSEYVLKHERVWSLLKEWYKATDEVSGIVQRDSATGNLSVDIFPLRFEVFLVDRVNLRPIKASTDAILIVPRSARAEELRSRTEDFLRSNNCGAAVPTGQVARVWVCEASAPAFSLLRDDVFQQPLRDIFTGLGKWKILLERKLSASDAWPFGDGARDVQQEAAMQDDDDGGADEQQAALARATQQRRARGASFVQGSAPAVGQLVDAKRAADGRWLEGVVVSVEPDGTTVRVHFLSFDAKEDETLDARDAGVVAPPHTHVPDWRTQLRVGEELEVHRRAVNTSILALKGTWLVGKVVRIDRSSARPAEAEGAADKSDGGDGELANGAGDAADRDVEMAPPPTSPSSASGAKKAKRTGPNLMQRLTSASKSRVRSPAASPAASSSGPGRGSVLLEVRVGTFYSQRKEVWVDLDSEDVAQRYTHTARPQTSYGPQGVQDKPPEAGVVGLRNLGNTCFMNSMLQCLSFSQPLTDFFLRGDYEADLNRKNPLGTGAKLAEAYAALLNDLWSDRFSVVAPNEFKQQLGQAFAQFQGYQQQDSHELLSLLADGLHEDLNRVRKKPYTEPVESEGRPDAVVAREAWDTFKLRNDSVVVDAMMGLLRSHLTCPVCKFETVKFDPYSSWSVPIPVRKTRAIRVLLYTMAPGSGGDAMLRPRAVRFVAQVPKDGSHEDVARWLAEATGIALRDLLLVDTYGNKCTTSPLFDPRDLRDDGDSGDAGKRGGGYGYRYNYNRELKNWQDDKDVIAFELAPVPAPEAGDDAAQNRMEEDDDDAADKPAASSSAYKYASALPPPPPPPPYHITELRFVPPGRKYQPPVRLSDAVRIPTGTTNRQVHQLVWARAQFMFDADALTPPPAFLRALQLPGAAAEPTGKRRSSAKPEHDDNEDDDDGPYEIGSSVSYAAPVACDDAEWDTCDVLEVKLTQAAVDALLHPTPPPVPYTSYSSSAAKRGSDDDDLLAKDAQYGIGPVAEDESLVAARRDRAARTDGVDLMQCLDKFREREQLGENDEWFCPKCKELVKAFKQMDLWSAPEILVVHLKRFYYERSRWAASWIDREKIGDLVNFPVEELDLREYVRGGLSESDPAPVYDLYAVSNHIGGMGGGHYTAYVKQPESGTWYLMDDSRATEVSDVSEVVSSEAYVVFYRRRPAA